jgi:hypothetical protein
MFWHTITTNKIEFSAVLTCLKKCPVSRLAQIIIQESSQTVS